MCRSPRSSGLSSSSSTSRATTNVDRYPWWALIVAAIGALVVFAILEVVRSRGPENRRKYGWIAIVIGADGRLSTSKTQALLWTIVLAITITFLGGHRRVRTHRRPPSSSTRSSGSSTSCCWVAPSPQRCWRSSRSSPRLQAGTIQTSLTPAASKTALRAHECAAPDHASAYSTVADAPVPKEPARLPEPKGTRRVVERRW